MLMARINVVEWFRAKSPSLARYKEGDLPLLNFSNLTCMMRYHSNLSDLCQNMALFILFGCVTVFDFSR